MNCAEHQKAFKPYFETYLRAYVFMVIRLCSGLGPTKGPTMMTLDPSHTQTLAILVFNIVFLGGNCKTKIEELGVQV